MKKLLFLLSVLAPFAPSRTLAQEASVEKSLWQVQTSFLDIWGSNERRLTSQLTLRGEAGFTGYFWYGSFYPKSGFAIVPVLTVEPRWYYNLEKRSRMGKPTDGNSANFLAFSTSFYPRWFLISNYRNVESVNQLELSALWGIRRSWKWVNFEVAPGVRYYYAFAKAVGYERNEGRFTIAARLRVGINLR